MAVEDLPIFDPQGKPHLTLVEYPPGVPPPEPPIITLGRDVNMTWDHVWGWIKSTASRKAGLDQIIADTFISRVLLYVEAYVGQQLHGLASVINNLDAAVYDGLQKAAHAFDWTYQHIHDLEFNTSVAIAGLQSEIDDLKGLYLPQIETDLLRLREMIDTLPGVLIPQLEAWSVGNIFDPLVDDIGKTDAKTRNDVFGLVAQVGNELQNQITHNHADVMAGLGVVAAVAAAAEKFVQDCGEPMCSTLGPNTDLFKLLKAFEAAGVLALLMEIGNMTEADVEARLKELAGQVQHIVSAFDDVFVGGGGSLHDFALSLL